MRDPTTILLAQDHAPERKESFYVKIKVSAFVNFEVGHLKKKKMMKKYSKTEVWHFLYVIIYVCFSHFEGLVW